MKLNNLSAKKICRLVSAGMVFSMLVITGIFGGIMQDIRIFIWECLVPEKEVNRIEQVYTVSNRKYGEDGVVLRLISREKPFANAKQVDPVLEDLYLFYFREGE